LPAADNRKLVLDRAVDNFFAETEQVAFCTATVVPGIDFSDDPLLQGRNFSYLDTQLKRLGGPNFTKIPINRPKGCPVSNYQQDGHTQITPRKGRVNYEPNGWGEGPREHPLEGYVSYRAPVTGEKARLRPESFADHYSEALQFYISQTASEQSHIVAALIFELSKCEEPGVRARIVSHLRNIDSTLAVQLADGLRLEIMPDPAPAARPTRSDLAPSFALSIQSNPPDSFKGRVLGLMISDGFDDSILKALQPAVAVEGSVIKLIAPKTGGARCSKDKLHPVDARIGRAPSVLFDAVAVLPGTEGLETAQAAVYFLVDAYHHCKFNSYSAEAAPLIDVCGLDEPADEGLTLLSQPDHAAQFVASCRQLRHWPRENFFRT